MDGVSLIRRLSGASFVPGDRGDSLPCLRSLGDVRLRLRPDDRRSVRFNSELQTVSPIFLRGKSGASRRRVPLSAVRHPPAQTVKLLSN